MKRMLINATQKEELRVAMVDGQHLFDLDIEKDNFKQTKSNIYKGKIARIEPSLEAVFVDYGEEKHGFLPFKEIAKEYLHFDNEPSRAANVKKSLKEGQDIIVQISKAERGNKGAALTTFISLAGSFLVLMPNNSSAGGVSRRVDGEDRSTLKDHLDALNVPEGFGLIVRTAGVGKDLAELSWDLKLLVYQWEIIQKAVATHQAPCLIYQESDVVVRAIRDYLSREIGEIVVDNREVFNKIKRYVSIMHHDFKNKVRFYSGENSLFAHYQIEAQIESAFEREVRLPSGGSLTIDVTEALTAIDVNSARATHGGDIEETAVHTNLEAADEIARQLRLRDLGGLVVIDFIDMISTKNQKEVENRLNEATYRDRAKIQLGKISRFGLLEMSRQRLRSSLGETSSAICASCRGSGKVRNNESIALSILRLIKEEASKDSTTQVHILVAVNIATYLLNEKREVISQIEKEHNITVVVVPNQSLSAMDFKVHRLTKKSTVKGLSYELPKFYAEQEKATTTEDAPRQKPVLTVEEVFTASELSKITKTKTSLIGRIWQKLVSMFKTPVKEEKKRTRPNKSNNKQGNRRKNLKIKNELNNKVSQEKQDIQERRVKARKVIEEFVGKPEKTENPRKNKVEKVEKTEQVKKQRPVEKPAVVIEPVIDSVEKTLIPKKTFKATKSKKTVVFIRLKEAVSSPELASGKILLAPPRVVKSKTTKNKRTTFVNMNKPFGGIITQPIEEEITKESRLATNQIDTPVEPVKVEPIPEKKPIKVSKNYNVGTISRVKFIGAEMKQAKAEISEVISMEIKQWKNSKYKFDGKGFAGHSASKNQTKSAHKTISS